MTRVPIETRVKGYWQEIRARRMALVFVKDLICVPTGKISLSHKMRREYWI